MSESGTAPTPKAPPARALMINVALSIFVSVVVFSVASFGILVPHMYEQKRQIEALNAMVIGLDARVAGFEAAVAPEAEQADAAAAPADAPAAEGAPEGAATATETP